MVRREREGSFGVGEGVTEKGGLVVEFFVICVECVEVKSLI